MFRFGNILLIFIVMAGCHTATAQRVMTARGSAEVLLGNDKSMDEAKEKARQLAVINAIENRVGTYVEQDASTYIRNGQSEFRIIGNTRVKGEWLKTIDESYEVVQKKIGGRKKTRETWITCQVKGEVREITRAPIDLKFIPLNCPDPVCRTYDFNDGEPFYLYFTSPVDGNLNIYMADDQARVYRLLPYKSMRESFGGEVPVKADSGYIFFAAGDKYNYFGDNAYQPVDEMIMESDGDREVMDLYIVFSPDEFDKPGLVRDNGMNGTVPFYLSRSAFDEWITENRIFNPEFTFRKVSLTVSK